MANNKNIFDSPVCVLICLFNSDGLSNALPQTSQGNKARSDFAGLLWTFGVISNNSLDDPADDDVRESPETDLCSSSAPDGGDIGSNTLDNKDVERSNGESVGEISDFKFTLKRNLDKSINTAERNHRSIECFSTICFLLSNHYGCSW
jgi:hypothetical protein